MDMVECDGSNSYSSIGSSGGDGGGAAGSHTVIPDHRREIAHCFAPLVSDVPKPFSFVRQLSLARDFCDTKHWPTVRSRALLFRDYEHSNSSWHEMLFSCTGRLALDVEGGMFKLVHMESFRHKVHPTSYWQTRALTLLQNMHM
ncbi:hypothetical protein V1478_013163, partial [Vespula squamosa]